MTVTIPRPSRGVGFRRLWTVELNNFDVEELMPSLFYRVISRGRNPGTHSNKPKEIDRFFGALAQHDRIHGFEGEAGRRLLERWARASIVEMSYAGRSRYAEQIEYVVPHTILSYQTGLPWWQTRQRNIHVFLYEQMLRAARDLLDGSPHEVIRDLFMDCFGWGVSLGPAPKYKGSYTGADIDIHALLSITFIDGFEPVEPATKSQLDVTPPALDRLAYEMGADVIRFLLAYKDHIPVQGLVRGIIAIVDFELYVYSIKLANATNALVGRGEIPAVMASTEPLMSPPELYVDFTRERRGVSDRTSQACVDRDIEEFRLLFDSTLLLRTLERFAEYIPEVQRSLAGASTPEYLKILVGLRDDSFIRARAATELDQIKHATREGADNEAEWQEAEAEISQTVADARGDLVQAAVQLLVAAQQSNGVNAYIKWIKSAGGLNQDYGLVVGNERGPRAWRYAMSDDLLSALVELAMIAPRPDSSLGVRQRLKLGDFLGFLQKRFGVVIDRPPAFLDDAERRSAASGNLFALKRRLRQMGYFEDLSDDFGAQYLTPTVSAPAGRS